MLSYKYHTVVRHLATIQMPLSLLLVSPDSTKTPFITKTDLLKCVEAIDLMEIKILAKTLNITQLKTE
jgi:hypothetical protein